VEHLDRKWPPELGDCLEQSVDSLVTKGCLTRVQGQEQSLELTPTGLLACKRGGEAAGLAMGILDMMKHRAAEEGSGFQYYNLDQVRPFIFTLEESHAFAATVIATMRLSERGTWGPWNHPFQGASQCTPDVLNCGSDQTANEDLISDKSCSSR